MTVGVARAVRAAHPLPTGAATVAFLTVLAALGQFASNVYTPVLPAVAREFDVSQATAQLTLAVFLAGFALAQLIYGPVSDRFGRRPVLLVALSIFLAGTGAAVLATSFASLMAARVVQAVGAAGAIVMSRAMTRDSFDGAALTRTLATVTIAFALVPGLSPLLGGLVQLWGGWRATFVAMLILGLVALGLATRANETNVSRTATLKLAGALSTYRNVLADPVFRTYSLAAAGVLASMSAFFAGSPALFIEQLKVSPVEYGLYPSISVTGFVIGGLLTRRLAIRMSPPQLAAIGLGLLGIGAAVMLALPLSGILNRFALVGAMTLHVTGLGVFLPTAVGAALQRFPNNAGAAAAMQGFLQMGGGALGAASVSLLQSRLPLLAFPLVMVAATGFAVTMFAVGYMRGSLDGARP